MDITLIEYMTTLRKAGLISLVFFLLTVACVSISPAKVETPVPATPIESPIKNITLFAFGGVYQTTKENIVSNHNLLLYFARFLSNFMIAAIFYGLYAIFINAGNLMIAGLAQWLALIYSMLFLLHFVPAFPLDGGMILRALLWRSSSDYYRATYIASLTGWSTGLLLIFAGFLAYIITQQWFVGLVVAAVGWFLYSAAAQTYRLAVLLVALQSTTAVDVMTREYPAIAPQMSIGQLVREQIIVKGWRYVIVVDSAKLEGALTIRDIRSVPRRQWDTKRISDIMTPAIKLRTANSQQSAAALLEEMDYLRIDHMPVLEDDHVIGVVTRDSLVRLGKTRAAFGF